MSSALCAPYQVKEGKRCKAPPQVHDPTFCGGTQRHRVCCPVPSQVPALFAVSACPRGLAVHPACSGAPLLLDGGLVDYFWSLRVQLSVTMSHSYFLCSVASVTIQVSASVCPIWLPYMPPQPEHAAAGLAHRSTALSIRSVRQELPVKSIVAEETQLCGGCITTNVRSHETAHKWPQGSTAVHDSNVQVAALFCPPQDRVPICWVGVFCIRHFSHRHILQRRYESGSSLHDLPKQSQSTSLDSRTIMAVSCAGQQCKAQWTAQNRLEP